MPSDMERFYASGAAAYDRAARAGYQDYQARARHAEEAARQAALADKREHQQQLELMGYGAQLSAQQKMLEGAQQRELQREKYGFEEEAASEKQKWEEKKFFYEEDQKEKAAIAKQRADMQLEELRHINKMDADLPDTLEKVHKLFNPPDLGPFEEYTEKGEEKMAIAGKRLDTLYDDYKAGRMDIQEFLIGSHKAAQDFRVGATMTRKKSTPKPEELQLQRDIKNADGTIDRVVADPKTGQYTLERVNPPNANYDSKVIAKNRDADLEKVKIQASQQYTKNYIDMYKAMTVSKPDGDYPPEPQAVINALSNANVIMPAGYQFQGGFTPQQLEQKQRDQLAAEMAANKAAALGKIEKDPELPMKQIASLPESDDFIDSNIHIGNQVWQTQRISPETLTRGQWSAIVNIDPNATALQKDQLNKLFDRIKAADPDVVDELEYVGEQLTPAQQDALIIAIGNMNLIPWLKKQRD